MANHSITGHKFCQKNDHSNNGLVRYSNDHCT
jgi:hypothetical protein